jgi:hypothetical protein
MLEEERRRRRRRKIRKKRKMKEGDWSASRLGALPPGIKASYM